MAFYGIEDASSKDLQQIVDLSANFATTDLLMNIILQNSFGESLNSVESRRALAKHRYDWALSNAAFSSNVLVSHNYYSPHLIEASAWIQFFGPDPSWFIPWKDESGTFKTSPDCANAHLYQYIENALHTDRKIYMHGKCHYYIHQLDFNVFENQSSSKEAARCLLSHISRIDPHVDKYAHFRIAHHEILQELQDLGWVSLGGLDINPEVADNNKFVTFPRSREKWVLRGVLDSAQRAVAVAASNSHMPSKPDSAGSTHQTSRDIFR